MAYREVSVAEIREILRLWLKGFGFRPIARFTSSDRKTVKHYVELAEALGVSRTEGEDQLDDDVIGALVASIQPGRIGARGDAWRACEAEREPIKKWLEQDLTLTKVHELLNRKRHGLVPYRTLHRFVREELGIGRRRTTIRVDDCKPGEELQVDFGLMGLIRDSETGERRKVWALIMTAVYSRHQFVSLTYRQTLEDIIEGFEAAWAFFGGVFHVVIPDNVKAIVASADPLDPKFTEGFLEYMQARGFVTDPARIRSPRDKGRVERAVPYVRESFFKGETFFGLHDARDRALQWCLKKAGLRDHGTTHRRPLEVFEAEEKSRLLPPPTELYDVPEYADVTVHHDQHIVIGKALYSVPEAYVGKEVHVRMDRSLVRISHRRSLIKVHPRQPPGGRSTDPEDFPEDQRIYAQRDQETLRRRAEAAGPSVAEYARRLIEGPAPWQRMRALYRLLGLAHRFGGKPVDRACESALALDVVDVTRIERIVKAALEQQRPEEPPPSGGAVIELRFARPSSHFAVARSARAEEEGVQDESR